MKKNNICHASAEDYLSTLPDDLIDLTVTSPPYDQLRSYHNIFDLPFIVSQLYRTTKDGGICVWVISDQTKKYSESGTSFKHALECSSIRLI